MKSVVALIAVGLVGVASAACIHRQLDIPIEFFNQCKRSHPHYSYFDIDQCLLNVFKKIFEEYKSMRNESIDPFAEKGHIIDLKDGHFEGTVKLSNIKEYGLSQLELLITRTNFTEEKDILISIDYFVPKLKSAGNFKYAGNLLGVKTENSGNFAITAEVFSGTIDFHAALVNIKGEKYLQVKDFDLRLRAGTIRLRSTELFMGNPELSDSVVEYLNTNPDQLLKLWVFLFEGDKAKSKLISVLNNVFLLAPFDELFPLSS